MRCLEGRGQPRVGVEGSDCTRIPNWLLNCRVSRALVVCVNGASARARCTRTRISYTPRVWGVAYVVTFPLFHATKRTTPGTIEIPITE